LVTILKYCLPFATVSFPDIEFTTGLSLKYLQLLPDLYILLRDHKEYVPEIIEAEGKINGLCNVEVNPADRSKNILLPK